MKRGILLVANKKSEDQAQNLVYSIRNSGCKLPIKLIHFGGNKVSAPDLIKEVELLFFEDFPDEAKGFVEKLRTILTDCPMGFLYRFLGWYIDWDQFIYTDNDIVALCNWEILFDYLDGYDLVHADEEYTTEGRFNYHQPEKAKKIFGDNALQSAITAGHIVINKGERLIHNIEEAIRWFKDNPGIAKKHDQALLHIASLLGEWKTLNLCKEPHNWMSSWSGDHRNSLELIQAIQAGNKISHIHYSGGKARGNRAIQDLLYAHLGEKDRLKAQFNTSVRFLSKYHDVNDLLIKVKRRLKS
jgi:hypothetical protein